MFQTFMSFVSAQKELGVTVPAPPAYVLTPASTPAPLIHCSTYARVAITYAAARLLLASSQARATVITLACAGAQKIVRQLQ